MARKATAAQIAAAEALSNEYKARIEAERTALTTGQRLGRGLESLKLIEQLEDEMSEKIQEILKGSYW